MRYKSILVVTLFASAMGSPLLAGTTHCTDPLRSIQYVLSTPDGGAPRPPIEYWTINGQQYGPASCEWGDGSPCPTDPDQAIVATWEDEQELWQKQHGQPGEGNAFFERIYTVRAKVQTAAAGKVLAHTYLICKQTYHNGLPRP